MFALLIGKISPLFKDSTMSDFDREDDPDFFFYEQERMRRLRQRESWM
jgi:hypothetical protein